MLKIGIADKYAMERGGWSSPTTLKKIYQHTMTSGKIDADNKMKEFFDGLTTADEKA